jgi:hypothetical protein
MADATLTGTQDDLVNNTRTATVKVPYKGTDIWLTVPISPQATSADDFLRETEAALRGLGQVLTNVTVVSPIVKTTP